MKSRNPAIPETYNVGPIKKPKKGIKEKEGLRFLLVDPTDGLI